MQANPEKKWKFFSYLKHCWTDSYAFLSTNDNHKRIFSLLCLIVSVGLFITIVYSRVIEVNNLANGFLLKSFVEPIQHQSNLNLQRKSAEEQNNKFVSYCSYEADRRGLNQNVISFSLYGNFSNERHFTRYVDPIKIILSNISQVYPGACRLKIFIKIFIKPCEN